MKFPTQDSRFAQATNHSGGAKRKRGTGLRFVALGVVFFTTQIGSGCLWWVIEGVHFKYPVMDFTRPPREFAHHYEDSDGWRPGTAYLAEGDSTPGQTVHPNVYDMRESGNAVRAHFVAKTLKLETKREYKSALHAWQIAWHRGYVGHGELRERIEVLRLLAEHPRLAGGADVLSAIPLNGHGKLMPEPPNVAIHLRPFAAYFRATDGSKAALEQANSLANLAGAYPRSPIAESALISIPRILLGQSAGTPTAASTSLAERAMHRLLARYPRTRFKNDVLGWRGRIAYLSGDYRTALGFYRNQLTKVPAGESVWRVTDSIELCERKLGRSANVAISFLVRYARSPEAAEKDSSTGLLNVELGRLKGPSALSFGHQIRSDATLLADYLDYRLDFSDPTPELADFEKARCLRGAPNRVRGHIVARIAEAAFRLNKPEIALRLARLTHSTATASDDLAMADYIEGSLARKRGHTTASIHSFERIVQRYSKSYLVGAARENLALLYESRHRLAEALDIYRKMKYDYDVDYMVDVRMPPAELRSYILDHPHDRQGDLLWNSLGYRYMRKHNWTRAEAAFKMVPRKIRLKLLNREEVANYFDGNSPIQDPLDTTRDLRRLSSAARGVRSSKARAKATLAEANYFYSRRNLLLYNGGLWKGTRAYVFAYSWNNAAANRADNKAIDQHFWEHECLSQAYLLCKSVIASHADRATKTRAAYIGASAAEHLAGMNEYWRWKNSHIHLMSEAVRLMLIAQKSPNTWLAARAKKYARVFADEQKTNHEYYADRTQPAPVFRPGWGYKGE